MLSLAISRQIPLVAEKAVLISLYEAHARD
jgi:hypothetical protein